MNHEHHGMHYLTLSAHYLTVILPVVRTINKIQAEVHVANSDILSQI